MLKARGMRATVFLVAGQIGGTNAWETATRQFPLLDAARIRALQAEGVRFGSHSVNHRPLARIPASDALEELTRSRGSLSELLGHDVDVFAYPFSNQSRTCAISRTEPATVRRARQRPHELAAHRPVRITANQDRADDDDRQSRTNTL